MTLNGAVDQSISSLLPSNWSQFLPDLIVALVTGLVIGFALNYVQRQSFVRDQVQDAQRSWDRLQSVLRSWFDTVPLQSHDKWVDEDRIHGILAAVDDKPIQDWARLLEHDDVLQALVRLEHNSHRVLSRAKVLDRLLDKVLPEVRPMELPQTMEGYREAAKMARSLTQESAFMTSEHQVRNQGKQDALVRKWAEDALADKRLAGTHAEFRITQGTIENDYRKIANAFKRADTLGRR